MFKLALRILAMLAFSLAYASSALAIEWHANSHKVLQGDYNSDGVTDFYLEAWPLPLVLPLNGLTTLVVPRTEHSFVLQSAAGGQYTLLRPLDMERVAQVAWTPAPYSTLVGDYNGDGLSDLLLRADVSGQDGLLLTQNSVGVASLAQVLNSRQLGIELSKAGGYQLQWQDVNGDGKADLLMTKVGAWNQVLLASVTGFAAAKSADTPVTDQPLSASAWGLTEGGSQVTLDGGFAYSLPLTMPAGINALQPSLALSYQMSSHDGYLGAGWGLSGLHSIHRCAATIAQDQYNGVPSGSAADKLCLDGQRLQLVSGSEWAAGSVYRPELDSIAQVTLKGSGTDLYFELREKNGWITTLGKTAASRLIPVGSTQPLAWQLDSITDRFNNQLTVAYSKAGGLLLPTLINYGGSKVEFTYRERANGPVQFALGGELRFDKLLDRVVTYAGDGRLAREYRLGYANSANSGQPRINYVQSCGITLLGARQCLSANTFAYQNLPNSLSNAGLLPAVRSWMGAWLSVQAPIDWNGDGINDLLTVNFDAIYVALGSATGLGANAKVLAQPAGSVFLTATPADVNSDGKQEILYLTAVTDTTPQQFSWAYVNADGASRTVASWQAASASSALTNFAGSLSSTTNVFMTAAKAVAFDASHDGYQDLLLPINGQWRLYQNNSGAVGTFADTGRMAGVAVSATDAPWLAPFSLEGDGKWQLLTTQVKNNAQYFALLPLGRQGGISSGQKVDLDIPVDRAVMLDVNGDGLQDFAAANTANQLVLYLNKGGPAGAANFKQVVTGIASTGIFPEAGPTVAHRRDNADYIPKAIDYDGDGRQDLLYLNNAAQRYELLRSTGSDFVASSFGAPVEMGVEIYDAAPEGCANYPVDKRPRLLAAINTATNAFVLAVARQALIVWDSKCKYLPAGPLSASTDSLVGDWNGDGQDDLLLAAQNNGQIVWRFYPQSRKHAEWLEKVTDSLGNLTQVTLKPTSDASVYEGSSGAIFPTLDWRGSRYVVNSLKQSDGLGGLSETLYEYRDARVNLLGRGYLGFAKVISKVPASQRQLTRTLRQDFPFIGALLKEESSLNGQIVARTSNTWAKADNVPGKVYFPYLAASNMEQFEGGVAVSASNSSQSFDNYGNPLTSVTKVAASLAGLSTPLHTTSISRDYRNDDSNWLIGFVSRETHSTSTGGSSRTRSHTYTQAGNSLALASETRFAGVTGLEHTSTYTRDASGRVTATTISGSGLASRTSTASNFQGPWPGTQSNALGHTTTASYDWASGKPSSVTDANNLTSSYSYDGFGRELLASNPDGSQQVTKYLASNANCPAGTKTAVQVRTINVAGTQQGAPERWQCLDSFGRVLRELHQGFAGDWVKVDSRFDSLGRKISQSQPYSQSQWMTTQSTSWDYLDRPLTQQLAGGAQLSYSYGAGWRQYSLTYLSYLPADQGASQTRIERRESNALGQLVKSINALGSPLQTSTAYAYDPDGNLSWTQVNGDVKTDISMTYDLAGNRRSLLDPNSGKQLMSYDALGQLSQVTASDGSKINSSYDLLGRLVSRSDLNAAAQPQEKSIWTYDGDANALGQLSGMSKTDQRVGKTGQSFSQVYGYDSLARLASRLTNITIGAGLDRSYSDSYSYDGFSRPLQTIDAAGLGLQHHYNGYGYLLGESNLADGKALRTINAQSVRDQVTEVSYGNGVVSTYAYGDDSGWLNSLVSNGSQGELQNLSYSYGQTGLLTSRTEFRGYAAALNDMLSESFSYDILQRLTQSTRTLGAQTLLGNYGYDDLGNLLKNPQRSSLTYGQYDAAGQTACAGKGIAAPGPHAVLRSNAGYYCYDARGNQLSGPGRRVSYSLFDKPLSITANGATSEFNYDPERRRFFQQSANRSTFYLDEGRFEEVVENGSRRQNSYVGGYLQYQYDPATKVKRLIYQLRDQLGSVEASLDAAGRVLERQSYAPFGGLRDGNWSDTPSPLLTSRRGFTDHEHLPESGLIHMNGRVYDPSLGRFLSADVVYQDTANAQAFNRYAYGFNSPFSGVDPTGYALEENALGNNWFQLATQNMGLVFYNGFAGNTPDSWGDVGIGAFKNVASQGLSLSFPTLSMTLRSYYEPYLSPSNIDQRAGSGAFDIGSLLTGVAGGARSLTASFGSRLEGFIAAKNGELTSDIARTFRGQQYEKIVLDTPKILGRYYDNERAFAKGRFMADPLGFSGSTFLDRVGLGLRPEWNAMTHKAYWELSAGSVVYKGKAATQFPWFGGKTQYFMPDLSSIKRVMGP